MSNTNTINTNDMLNLAIRFAKAVLNLQYSYIPANTISCRYSTVSKYSVKSESIITFTVFSDKNEYINHNKECIRDHRPLYGNKYTIPAYYQTLTNEEMIKDWTKRQSLDDKKCRDILIKNIESMINETYFKVFRKRIYEIDNPQNNDEVLKQLKTDIIMWISKATGIQSMNKCEIFYIKAVSEKYTVEYTFKYITELIDFYNSVKP